MLADALSCRPYPALNYLVALASDLCEQFWSTKINVVTLRAITMETHPTLIKEICVVQAMDLQLEQIREEVLAVKAPGFVIHKNSTIRFHNRVCVQAVEELKMKI